MGSSLVSIKTQSNLFVLSVPKQRLFHLIAFNPSSFPPSRTMKQASRTSSHSSDDRLRPGNNSARAENSLMSLLSIPAASQGERFSPPNSLHLGFPRSLHEILDEALALIDEDLDFGDLSGCPEESHSLSGLSAAAARDQDQDMRQ